MNSTMVAAHPNSKSADLFRNGYEDLDSEFFDQFLTFSPVDGEAYDGLPDTYPSSSNSNAVATPFSVHHNGAIHSSNHQPRRHSSWATGPAKASSQYKGGRRNGFYTELSGRAAVSDSELLTLERISLDSPRVPVLPESSLPATPSPSAPAPSRRKGRLVESISKTFKEAAGNLQSSCRTPIRKTSSLSKMAHYPNHSRTGFDHWGNKIPEDRPRLKFEFEGGTTTLSFEDSTTAPSIVEESPDHFEHNGNRPQNTPAPATHDTPQATPELCGGHSRKTSDTYLPITPQLHSSATFWPQTPGISDLSPFESTSAYPPPSMKMPLCVNDTSPSPLAQPLPIGFHANPQLATKNLAYMLQRDLAYDNDHPLNSTNMTSGLMIQTPQASTQRALMVENIPRRPQQDYQVVTTSQRSPSLRRKTAQVFPRQPHQSSLCNMHPDHSSGSEPSSPTSSSFTARKRKSPKTKQGSEGRGNVGFVNLTPDDSWKILTGVAPSGSSKTKARRDKEAMDKRRKLSQAALRAVKAAGGDVNSLVEQGLIV